MFYGRQKTELYFISFTGLFPTKKRPTSQKEDFISQGRDIGVAAND